MISKSLKYFPNLSNYWEWFISFQYTEKEDFIEGKSAEGILNAEVEKKSTILIHITFRIFSRF